MGNISSFPVAEVRTWIEFENGWRPWLAALGLDPDGVEHVLAQVKIVYDKYGMGCSHSLVLKSEGDSAASIQNWNAARDFYLPMIFGLMCEICLREMDLYHCNAGASGLRTKPSDPPSSTGNVVDFPPK